MENGYSLDTIGLILISISSIIIFMLIKRKDKLLFMQKKKSMDNKVKK